jgi:hypothetical protein
VRKNGSGYYLVMHPLHPAAGRPDFVPWVLGKQHMSLLDIPSPAKESQSKSTNPAVPGHPARHLLSAMSLRQMSRDLGATPSAPKQMRPPQQAVLSALANLGLPTPAVTGGKPGSGARRGAALEQAEPGDEVSDVGVPGLHQLHEGRVSATWLWMLAGPTSCPAHLLVGVTAERLLLDW